MYKNLKGRSIMNRLNPILVYLVVRGLWSLFEGIFFFLLPVYYIQNAGMDPLQLVLVDTVMQVTIFVFEVPTGVVADSYSRKLSVISGMLTGGLCFVVEGFVPVFAFIILAEFLRAIGETFISGAFTAWITDEIGVEKVGRVLMRANQASQITGIVSTGIGIWLSTFLPLGAIISAGGLGVALLAVFMIFAMSEENFKPSRESKRAPLSQSLKTGWQVVRGRPLALTIGAMGLAFGSSDAGFDRLWEAHLIKDFTVPLFTPAEWFGFLWIAAQLANLLLLEIIIRRVKLGNSRGILKASMATQGILLVSLAIFALAGDFYVALLACLVARTFRTTGLFPIWVNRNLDSRVRATIISFDSQVEAVGHLVGGPLTGFIGTAVSIPAALLTSALLLAPCLPLFGNALRLTKQKERD
jgi:DHA3 family tetracycline resistance protein-like MFS transporter